METRNKLVLIFDEFSLFFYFRLLFKGLRVIRVTDRTFVFSIYSGFFLNTEQEFLTFYLVKDKVSLLWFIITFFENRWGFYFPPRIPLNENQKFSISSIEKSRFTSASSFRYFPYACLFGSFLSFLFSKLLQK